MLFSNVSHKFKYLGKHMKNYLIIGYVLIALICSVYFKNFSSTAHYSYAYNLGKAVVWPVTIFKN